jgi:hypothetical protein
MIVLAGASKNGAANRGNGANRTSRRIVTRAPLVRYVILAIVFVH